MWANLRRNSKGSWALKSISVSEIETEEMVQQLKNQLAQELEFYNVRKELKVLAEENLKAAELNDSGVFSVDGKTMKRVKIKKIIRLLCFLVFTNR